MEPKAWWRSRRFELGLAVASVIFIVVGMILDWTAHELVERFPITANVAASFLSLPLLSLAAILVLNRGEQSASESYRNQVALRRGMTKLAERHHRLGQALLDAMLLTEEVASLLRGVGNHEESGGVDWSALSANFDSATLVRLVEREPRSTEGLLQELTETSEALEGVAELAGEPRIRQVNADVGRSVERLEGLLEPARGVLHGIRMIRGGRTWNGTAVVDSSGGFNVGRLDFINVAERAPESRRAVEDARDGLSSVIEGYRRQPLLAIAMRLRRALAP